MDNGCNLKVNIKASYSVLCSNKLIYTLAKRVCKTELFNKKMNAKCILFTASY